VSAEREARLAAIRERVAAGHFGEWRLSDLEWLLSELAAVEARVQRQNDALANAQEAHRAAVAAQQDALRERDAERARVVELQEALRREVAQAHDKAAEYEVGSPDHEYHRGRAHGLARAAARASGDGTEGAATKCIHTPARCNGGGYDGCACGSFDGTEGAAT
jgi:predicted nuclease with TOPRIM domain